ncbi:cache domain-containing sensor histidine kinase [Paenibacillus sabuli]|uniref:cache domain-containing sensor histidine kinase n=1 Tax=Paenibacillus sabuli TaxID=2772509 RepID=UPI00295BCB37|nr:sensor histidine kinase [Paenibacillus sabuli]
MNNPLSRLRDRFQSNIQFRLTCYFLLILLPLVLASLFAVERSRHILLEQAAERSETALSSAMDYIDLTLQNVEEISTLVATDPDLLQLLNKHGERVDAAAVVDFAQVLGKLSNVNSVNRMVSQIAVYHMPSQMLVSTRDGGRMVDVPAQRRWLERIAAENGTAIAYLLAEEEVGGGQLGELAQTDGVSLVRTMDLYNSQRRGDLVLISLDMSRLTNLMQSLLPSPGTTIYLRTETGQIVAGSSRAEGGDVVPASSPQREEDAGMLTVSIDSSYSNWQLTMRQPRHELYAKTDQLRVYTLVIIVISILLALGISWVIYAGIAAPVDKLVKGMKRVGGGALTVRLDNRRQDELGYLTEAFNRMVVDQRRLIEDHYEQQLRLAKTELNFLQAQINPHFLYNTLNSIHRTAQNYEAEEISEMVLNLSRFFRLSLNKGEAVITVDECLSHLHYYVRVQQLRFLDSFAVEYRVEAAARDVPILKLLLQPLVENAILHGLEGRDEGGRLLVAVRVVDERLLQIEVRDNGAGMSAARAHYVRQEMERLARQDFHLYSVSETAVRDLFGLRNVLARIKLYYGAGAELAIESREGEGTAVTLRLPLRSREALDAAALPVHEEEQTT